MKSFISDLKIQKDLANVIITHLIRKWRLQVAFSIIALGIFIMGLITPFIVNYYFFLRDIDPISNKEVVELILLYLVIILSSFLYYRVLKSSNGKDNLINEIRYFVYTWKYGKLLYIKTINSCEYENIMKYSKTMILNTETGDTSVIALSDKKYEYFMNKVIRVTLYNIFNIYLDFKIKNKCFTPFPFLNKNLVLNPNSLSKLMDTKKLEYLYSYLVFEKGKNCADSYVYNTLYNKIFKEVLKYIQSDKKIEASYKEEDVAALVDTTLGHWCEMLFDMKLKYSLPK
jgi:hypothetical protein